MSEASALIAVTQGPYRAMRPLAPSKAGDIAYFDHTNDPWEAKNLALAANGGSGALPPELSQSIDNYLAAPPTTWGKPKEVELNEMELSQLRALGYVVK